MHPERALRTAQLVNRLAGVVTNFISISLVVVVVVVVMTWGYGDGDVMAIW